MERAQEIRRGIQKSTALLGENRGALRGRYPRKILHLKTEKELFINGIYALDKIGLERLDILIRSVFPDFVKTCCTYFFLLYKHIIYKTDFSEKMRMYQVLLF